MSVYIKSIEMPPDGRYTLCITHDSDGGVHWVIQNQDMLEFSKHGAVTEITEPHGRLIDADALRSVLRLRGKEFSDSEYGEGVKCGLADAREYIKIAPTIIPAS